MTTIECPINKEEAVEAANQILKGTSNPLLMVLAHSLNKASRKFHSLQGESSDPDKSRALRNQILGLERAYKAIDANNSKAKR